MSAKRIFSYTATPVVAQPIKSGKVIIATYGMMQDGVLVPCNRTASVFIDEINQDLIEAKYGVTNPKGVNGQFLGFLGRTKNFNFEATMVGFTSAQVYCEKPVAGAVGRTVRRFVSAVAGVDVSYPVQVYLNTLIDGEADVDSEAVPSADAIAIRSFVRKSILAGESFSRDGMTLDCVKPMADILSNPAGSVEKHGVPTGRHLFLVVAEQFTTSVHKKEGAEHLRVSANKVVVYHIDSDHDRAFDYEHVLSDKIHAQVGRVIERKPVITKPMPTPKKISVPTINAQVVIPATKVAKPAEVKPTQTEETPVIKNVSVESAPIALPATSAGELANIAKASKFVGLAIVKPVEGFDTIEGIKAALSAAGIKRQNVGNTIAHAMRLYLCAVAGADEPKFAGIHWTAAHIKGLVDVVRLLMSSYGFDVNLGLGYDDSAADTLLVSIGSDTNCYRIDRRSGIVYDKRGRAFSHTVEANIGIVNKKSVLNGLEVCSSLGNFTAVLYYAVAPMIGQWKMQPLTNLAANVEALLNKVEISKMSTDKLDGQNSANMHYVVNSYSVVAAPSINFWVGGKVVDLSGEHARSLANFYKHTSNTIPGDLGLEVIAKGMKTFGFDYHFTKKAFVTGSIGHVNLNQVKELAPSWFALIADLHGSDLQDKVVALTTKAAKGLKRVTLSLAQSVPVVNSKPCGWRLEGQKEVAEGALISASYAPTLILPPGINAWVGDAEDMPIALNTKVFNGYVVSDYRLGAELFSTEMTALDGVELATSTNNAGWTVLTPIEDVIINAGEVITYVNGNTGVTAVAHESTFVGRLISIKYREENGMTIGSKHLVISYVVESVERYGKMRSFSKGQYIQVNGAFLENARNEISAEVNCVYAQDALKTDTLYAWIMAAGNTVAHNQGNPVIAKLESLVKAANLEVTGVSHSNYIHINPVAVIAGVYDAILVEFESVFGEAVWYCKRQVGDQGRIELSLKETSKWTELPSKDGVRTFVDGDINDHHTNVYEFVIVNGVVETINQRAFSLIGKDGCSVYNVELFESSTVGDAVGTSVQMASYIRALGHTAVDPIAVSAEQHRMVEGGKDTIFVAKALAAMISGSDFASKNVITKVCKLMQTEEGVSLSPKALEVINAKLEANGIDVNRRSKTLFADVTKVLVNVVFTFTSNSKATSMWLPALASLSKVKTDNENCLSLSSKFMYEMLVPMLQGKVVPTLVVNQLRGKLEALVASKNSRKLIRGLDNAGAKRVALPCIPCGEVWVLASSKPNSVYMTFKRGGINVDAARRGVEVLVYNNRAPMSAGVVTKVVIVEQDENGRQFVNEKEIFWMLSDVQLGVGPMSVYLDGGDFDGDGHYCTALHNVPSSEVHTFERVNEIRSNVLGVNMISSQCDAYAADHYTTKSWKKASATLGAQLKASISSGAIKTIDEYVTFNQGAFVVQNVEVGVAYEFYMVGEHLIDILAGRKAAGYKLSAQEQAFVNAGSQLVLALAEIYEVMLGGFSEAALNLWVKCIDGKLNAGKPCTQGELLVLKACLEGMGINPQIVPVLADMFDTISMYFAIKKEGFVKAQKAASGVRIFDDLCAAMVAFELGRDKFDGWNGIFAEHKEDSKHRGALLHTKEVMVNNFVNDHNYAALLENSFVMKSLVLVFRHMSQELVNGKSVFNKDEAQYFIDLVVGKEDNSSDDNNDGGSPAPAPVSPAPIAPSDNEVEVEEVEQMAEFVELVVATPASQAVEVATEVEEVEEEVEQMAEFVQLQPIQKEEVMKEKVEVAGDVQSLVSLIQAANLNTAAGIEAAKKAAQELVVALNQVQVREVATEVIEEVADVVEVAAAPVVEEVKEVAAITTSDLAGNDWYDNLTAGQRTAVDAVASGQNIFLCGEAGTGKSYTMELIRDYMKSQDWKVVVTGTTGVSVLNVQGDGTLNSICALKTGFDNESPVDTFTQAKELVSNALGSKAIADIFNIGKKKGILFVIDEVSMMDARLFYVVKTIASRQGVNIQWLLLGDPLQLPVVRGTEFFDNARLQKGGTTFDRGYQLEGFAKVTLTEIVRQSSDPEFGSDLSNLRTSAQLGKTIVERIKASSELPEEATHFFPTNRQVEDHNTSRRDALIAAGASHATFTARVKNFVSDNSWMKDFAPIQEEMIMVVGMPIMIRMNLRKAQVTLINEVTKVKNLVAANGTIGRITKVDPNGKYIHCVLPNGNEVRIDQMELHVPNKADGTPKGVYIQLPCHAAWAMTFHKVQGLTITTPVVVHPYRIAKTGHKVALSGDATGALYVACSRVVSRDLLFFGEAGEFGFNLARASAHVNRKAVAWLNSN